MTNITPSPDHTGGWINVLKGAADAIIAGQPHKYIAAKSEGRSFRLIDSSKINEANPKLSIREIVDISKAKLQELGEAFEEGKITAAEFTSQSRQISQYTRELIDGRVEKREQSAGLRSAARVAAFVFGFVVGGVILDYLFKRMDKDFEKEIAGLRKDIREATPLHHGAERVAEILVKVQEEITDDARLKALQDQLRQDVQVKDKDASGTYIHQFAKDMKRFYSFFVSDPYSGMDGKVAQPVGNLQGSARVAEGAKVLQGLFGSEQDTLWESALQAAINQATISSLYGEILSEFNGGDASKIEWIDSTGRDRALALSPGEIPPIRMEIIRNKAGEIIRVDVEVEGSLSFSNGSKIIQPDVVKCSLKYSMVLDDQNQPVIKKLTSTMTT